tara:strand:+ start:253 stop:834 length:582 start_codon:yes stop_codon:yes gene_type:complete
MSDLARIIISVALYVLLFGYSVISLVEPVDATEPLANYPRMPAIDNAPPQVAAWSLSPTVVVCQHAPISQIQIKSAIKFWQNLGYTFENVRYKEDPTGACTSDRPWGYIVIHLVDKKTKLEPTALAQTHFFVDNLTGKINWATIRMRPDVRETVLEHELGHALGFLHFNRIDHLMNQKWEMGGWDSLGLRSNR